MLFGIGCVLKGKRQNCQQEKFASPSLLSFLIMSIGCAASPSAVSVRWIFYDDEELILEPGYLNSEDFTKDVQNETEA
ncbi:hypothetical protein P4U24_13925 [Aeribacillus composti]|uniref:hypothetical protein n=1 Tax=Aeribacillus composti TaxID=1868734 RepID=UPI002E1CFD7A|nr:hypothetical protein [Aeribacillus composti]